jgi:hypothetical protein
MFVNLKKNQLFTFATISMLITDANSSLPIPINNPCCISNYLNNGSFETGTWVGNENFADGINNATDLPFTSNPNILNNWSHDAAKWIYAPSKAAAGNYLFWLKADGVSSNPACVEQSFTLVSATGTSSVGNLVKGKTYKFCFKYASFDANDPNVLVSGSSKVIIEQQRGGGAIQVLDSSQIANTVSWASLPNAWQTYSINIFVPTGSGTTLKLFISTNQIGRGLLIDDVKICELCNVSLSAATVTSQQATCNGNVTQQNAFVKIKNLANALKYSFSTSGTTGLFYSTAQNITGDSIFLNNLSNPTANTTYTVRIYGADSICYKDTFSILSGKFCFVQQLTCGMLVDSFKTEAVKLAHNSLTPIQLTTLGQDILLGGERDLLLTQISSTTAPIGNGLYSGSGILDMTNGTGEFSQLIVQWDGRDSNATSLNYTGLGGLNFAALNIGKVTAELTADFPPTTDSLPITIELWTNNNLASAVTRKFKFPNDAVFRTITLPFTELMAIAGSGVDLTNIGAMVLKVNMLQRNGWDVALQNLKLECCTTNAGVDVALFCAGGIAPTSHNLNQSASWTILSQPMGASPAIDNLGNITNMSLSGNYIFRKTVNECSDEIQISVPNCIISCPPLICLPVSIRRQ